jgi:putative spermidine/putrescine transport system permease protein
MKHISRVLFIAFFLFPLLYLGIRMFAGIWSYPALLPESWTGRALAYILANRGPVLRSLGSSTAYSLTAVLISLFFSYAPARVLARRNFAGKSLVQTLLLAPLLVPAVVYALGLFPLMLRLGISDRFGGVALILALSAFPYMLRALQTGFASIPREYEISAYMLGARGIRIFSSVYLPQMLPALLSGATVVFLAAFSEYFLVFLIGGGLVSSYSGYLVPLIRASDWSISSALILIFLLVPLMLYALMERLLSRYYRRRGMGMGEQLGGQVRS